MEIIAGLKSPKLKPFWQSVNEPLPVLEYLSSALLSSEYERALSRALAMPECPVVPFFGAFLRELREVLTSITKKPKSNSEVSMGGPNETLNFFFFYYNENTVQELANRREENIRKRAEEEKQKLEEEIRREKDIRRRRETELLNNTYMEITTPENPNRQKTLSNQDTKERNLELRELNDIKNKETEEMLRRVSKELEEIKIHMHINSTPKNNNKEKELRDHDHIQPPLDLPRTYQRQQQQGLQREELLHEDNPTTTYPTPNIVYNQIPPNERYQPKAQQIKAWGIIFPDGKLDAEDFIRKVDNKFLAENIHKNVALGIVREMLTGYVLDWFDNSRRKWRDWDQFKEIFQDTFSIYQDDTDRQRAIYEQTRRQNETYVQFAIRIQSAYEKIRNPPIERSQVSHVIKTFPMEVGSYLSPEAKYTWNQLIKELNIVDQKRENKTYLRYSNEKTTARGKPSIKQAKIENSDSENSTMNEENELDNNSEEEEENLKIQLIKPNNKMKNKPYKKSNEEKNKFITKRDLETMVKAIQAGTATDISPTPVDPTVTALNTLSLTMKEMLQCIKELKTSNSLPTTNPNNNFICYRCNQQVPDDQETDEELEYEYQQDDSDSSFNNFVNVNKATIHAESNDDNQKTIAHDQQRLTTIQQSSPRDVTTLYASVKIQNLHINGLIDTGATISLINVHLYDQLKAMPDIVKPRVSTLHYVTLADGSKGKVLVHVEIERYFDGQSIYQSIRAFCVSKAAASQHRR
ncbi:hypothetical protein PV328_002600 [Microctonus aethiopoides]|uniref:Retrotransposon gag domain-containing protein n=1 Tax=Microctonus aethiopoides TaxID=144406 RepID=A0AA39KJL1_9HYME|nr:hypothetical protein PV328_002600 [Microctonus aethiopoides]